MAISEWEILHEMLSACRKEGQVYVLNPKALSVSIQYILEQFFSLLHISNVGALN